MADEIYRRQKSNLARTKSLRQRLEMTLLDYHNRLIDAKEVIEQMIAIRREINPTTSAPRNSVSP